MPRPELLSTHYTHRRAKVVLMENDLTQPELAKRLGVTFHAVNQAILGSPEFPALRRKIERKLGEPIWSLPGDFEKLARAEAVLGVDPMTAKKRELLGALRKHKVPGWEGLKLEELFDLAMNYVQSLDQTESEPARKGNAIS